MFSSVATPFHMPTSYGIRAPVSSHSQFSGWFSFLTVANLVGVKQYILHILGF